MASVTLQQAGRTSVPETDNIDGPWTTVPTYWVQVDGQTAGWTWRKFARGDVWRVRFPNGGGYGPVARSRRAAVGYIVGRHERSK